MPSLRTGMIIVPSQVKFRLPESQVPRSKGVHVSAIIRSIALEMGILKTDQAEGPSLADVREIINPEVILRMAIGLAWEDWYLNNILNKEGVVKHPGETKVDGIHMTPDGVSLDTIDRQQVLRVHEVKATYKSTKTVGDVSQQWLWLTQM